MPYKSRHKRLSYLKKYRKTHKDIRKISRYSWRKNRRQLNYDLIAESKSNKKCVDCNRKYPPYVLDYHHIGPKKFPLTRQGISMRSLDAIRNEIDKCVLICSNCHRIRHHGY